MLVLVVKLCLNGKILGYIPRSVISVKVVVPLVSIVISLLTFFLGINNVAALLALTLLFGLRLSTMDATLLLFPCLLICILIFHVVFAMQVA